MLSPISMNTISPGTSILASIFVNVSDSSLLILASLGMKFLKSAIKDAAFDVCAYEKKPVIKTTQQSTIPRNKLSEEELSKP